jgi:hypothetical protein
MAKVTVYRIKYEIAGNTQQQWLTTIAAYSMEDAQNFISKVAGNKAIQLHEFGTVTKLDAVTDAVAERIARDVRPPAVIKEEKPKFVCTFCGRDDFKNDTGLKGHITRWCEEAEKLRSENVKEPEPDTKE